MLTLRCLHDVGCFELNANITMVTMLLKLSSQSAAEADEVQLSLIKVELSQTV